MRQLLTTCAIKLNYLLRSHPSKYLYSERLLSGFTDPVESEHINCNWFGPVWDVGASVGKYTTTLARHNLHRVYAFEPNLNSLYYLAHRTREYTNVVIVPNALTTHGFTQKASFNPDFTAKPTGPHVTSISLDHALESFGIPKFIKLDIEGAEYELLTQIESTYQHKLRDTTMLISWHNGIKFIGGWRNKVLSSDITLLSPI